MIGWDEPLAFVHGLTAQQRRVLKSLEVETVGEMLMLLPRRYDDYSRLTSIAEIPTGVPVTIRATVKSIAQAPTFRKRFAIIKAVVSDETGSVAVTWFNQPWFLKQLTSGAEIFLSGTVTQRPRFGRGFTSPLWEPASDETLAAGMVAPVYPLAGSITQKTLRKIMKVIVDEVAAPPDPIPAALLKQAHLPSFGEAIRLIHRPTSLEEAERGRRRIAFGELLLYRLALGIAREDADKAGAPSVSFDEPFAKTFSHSLPFELTDDQKKAVWAAVKDMQTTRPMRRLLQGDVGSGKTAVAAMLAALTFRAGSSAVVMAPTDLLAKQHAATLRRFLIPHGIPVLLMTSSARILFDGVGAIHELPLQRTEARERISRGRLVVVGTHALLEQGAMPPDVGLSVVDEQHRFGVAQREALAVSSRPDGKVPHLLSMTATPIPRSLALVLFGDLEVSVIRTKPTGRKPVTTRVVVGEDGREQAYRTIREEAERGHPAFVVCPLIDPSDKVGTKSVEDEARRLASGSLHGLRIGMVHGRMSAKDKDETMSKMANGDLDVLVATTVVEVGVDVPQATVILIEGAERFGLAQLHQLRGRVGRSEHPSQCFLAATDDNPYIARLRILERTNDGFEVAEADLKQRGEGNLLGVEQSGEAVFQAARLDDLELMAGASEAASGLLSEDVTLSKYPELKKMVTELRQTSHQE